MFQEFNTIEEARQRRALRYSVLNPKASPYRSPVIIHGPNEGYCVVTLGFAEKEGFEVLR